MRILVALAVLGALLAMPSGAAANGGVGFRPDPASPVGMDAGYLRVTAAPGASATGSFIATNTSAAAASLQIYPADGLTGTTTGVVYGDEAARDAGAWVTPSQTAVTVGGASEQPVSFTVRVPANASAGDHVASVVLQQRKGGGSVSQVVRNVVPVLINVPGGAGPQIRLDKVEIGRLPGTAASAVTVGLRNDGNRMCRPQLSVALTGGRESGQAVTRQLDTILPGDAVPYPLPWPRALAAGTYEVRVVATGCGTTQTDTLTATTSPETDEVATTAPARTTPSRTTPAPSSAATPARRVARPGASGADALADRINVTPVPAPAGEGQGAGAAGAAPPAAAAEGDSGVVDKVRDLLREHGVDVLERASLPLAILMMLGIAVVAQEAIDRRDPKLALAPVHADPDLAFDHEPVERIGHASNPAHPVPGTSPVGRHPG